MKTLSFFFVFLLAFLLVQCADPPVSPVASEVECYKGGPGGGGHTETAVNNLSFPAL